MQTSDVQLKQHLILSPHLDDAWFSLSGCIARWRAQHELVRVLDIFSIQGYTELGDLPVNEVTRLRKAEEEQNASAYGVEFIFSDIPESQLRGYELKFPQTINPDLDTRLIRQISAQIYDLALQSRSLIHVPMGIGGHVDHLCVRDAATSLLQSHRSRYARFDFYEDLPYAAKFSAPADFIEELGLVPRLVRIAIRRKLQAVTVYRSQLYTSLPKMIQAYARSLRKDGQYYERTWSTKSVL